MIDTTGTIKFYAKSLIGDLIYCISICKAQQGRKNKKS